MTSGQEKTAYMGRHLIKNLVELSGANGVQIIAGAGINSSNLSEILKETKCPEFHASCRSSRISKMVFKNSYISMGSPSIDEFEIKFTDKLKCQELAGIYKNHIQITK